VFFNRNGVTLDKNDATYRAIAGARGVVLYGFSLGTAIAAYAASQTPVAGVILAAPPASAQERTIKSSTPLTHALP